MEMRDFNMKVRKPHINDEKVNRSSVLKIKENILISDDFKKRIIRQRNHV